MPVRGRTARVLAAELTGTELTAVVKSAVARAKGDGQVANQAAKLVVDLVQLAHAAGDEDVQSTELVDFDSLTPAQRAAKLAQIDRLLAAMDEADGDAIPVDVFAHIEARAETPRPLNME